MSNVCRNIVVIKTSVLIKRTTTTATTFSLELRKEKKQLFQFCEFISAVYSIEQDNRLDIGGKETCLSAFKVY
jgi:hypothetical protein